MGTGTSTLTIPEITNVLTTCSDTDLPYYITQLQPQMQALHYTLIFNRLRPAQFDHVLRSMSDYLKYETLRGLYRANFVAYCKVVYRVGLTSTTLWGPTQFAERAIDEYYYELQAIPMDLFDYLITVPTVDIYKVYYTAVRVMSPAQCDYVLHAIPWSGDFTVDELDALFIPIFKMLHRSQVKSRINYIASKMAIGPQVAAVAVRRCLVGDIMPILKKCTPDVHLSYKVARNALMRVTGQMRHEILAYFNTIPNIATITRLDKLTAYNILHIIPRWRDITPIEWDHIINLIDTPDLLHLYTTNYDAFTQVQVLKILKRAPLDDKIEIYSRIPEPTVEQLELITTTTPYRTVDAVNSYRFDKAAAFLDHKGAPVKMYTGPLIDSSLIKRCMTVSLYEEIALNRTNFPDDTFVIVINKFVWCISHEMLLKLFTDTDEWKYACIENHVGGTVEWNFAPITNETDPRREWHHPDTVHHPPIIRLLTPYITVAQMYTMLTQRARVFIIDGIAATYKQTYDGIQHTPRVNYVSRGHCTGGETIYKLWQLGPANFTKPLVFDMW